MPDDIVWSAPVRYAEVDQQGIVFNAHYLVYADEAMGAFCARRGLLDFAAGVHLVSSAQTWSAPARWGEVIEVRARCVRVGSSSVRMRFDIEAAGRPCCVVETTYVHADAGRSAPIPDTIRAALG